MPRRRKRKLKPAPILWLLLIVNVLLGVFYSPITGASRVHVVGAYPSDHARIEKALQSLLGVPCARVNAAAIEESIMRRPDVSDATLKRNPLGSDELVVHYSPPVALLKDTKNVVLTSSGVICEMPEPPAGLPNLALFPGATNPNLTQSARLELLDVSEVCQKASESSLVKDLWISVSLEGSVCLNSGKTGRVVLGIPDGLDEKFSKLREVLAAQPNLLSEGKELNLIAPAKPVTKPLSGESL